VSSSISLPKKVLSVDFETTGLNVMYDAPMSMAVMVLDGELTGEVFHASIEVPANVRVSVGALTVQGLQRHKTPEEIAAEIARLFPTGADPIELVLSNLSDWLIENKLTGSPCIAHQASFDLGFYEMAVRRCEKQKAGLGPIWICTKSLAKLVLPGLESYSLDSCCRTLGIEGRKNVYHDSFEDAELCARVYAALRGIVYRK